ncbi:hypothetical protein CAL26_03970 [Bordetella genomosp. 9]|uniref:Uncharacterized protein n=1 Tax=Bordetella genomosp. 9 TaxID=1416803 RepID=A0A261RP84_9BORD|nr:hypothetical protein [Bordetella genomosp. 9]OZI26492.1 hypothetical protein CAL26_03970 [Bordetella genomosp. 9]
MKKPDPELIDEDSPEWKDAEFKRARPASEVLPEAVTSRATGAGRQTRVGAAFTGRLEIAGPPQSKKP